MHVGNDAVGDDEQHEIVFAVLELASNRDSVTDDRRKIRGAKQLHRLQPISIVVQNFFDTRAMWMRWISIQWKLMGDIVIGRNFGTKT